MATTRVTQLVRAPRGAVYRALLDARAVHAWNVPDGMTSEVHTFEPREGGAFRISLTYDHDAAGKTTGRTDTYAGRFTRLVPDALVVQTLAFETGDPALMGEMTITFELVEVAGGTEVRGTHEGVPAAVPPADNELGWQISLRKLAALVEASVRGS